MPSDRKALPSAAYDVGYRRPPMATRFQKGHSGNPSGRPKGRKNLATVLSQALQVKIPVTEAGRRRLKTKLEVAITQVVNKAASGDLRALGQILGMQALLSDSPQEQVTPDLAADRLQAQRMLARMLGEQPGEDGHE